MSNHARDEYNSQASPEGLTRRSHQRTSNDPADDASQDVQQSHAPTKYDESVHSNPFSYWPEYSIIDYIMMALMIPLLPIKLLGMILCFLVSLVVSRLTLIGVDRTSPPTVPFSGYRSSIGGAAVFFLIRSLFFFMGILWIQFKRVEHPDDEPQDASVEELASSTVVAAPHRSYLDSAVVPALHSAPVARMSSRNNIFTGWPMDAIQTIWVDRHSVQGRQQAADSVLQRQHEDGWPPVVIFAEGTTTAGNVLYYFKNGAFRGARPVQPITIQYDVPTSANPCFAFAWDGPATWKSTLQILLEPYIVMTINFLPVYVPNDAECADADLYAANVQKMFSQYLNMPYSKITLEDAEMYARKVQSVHSKRKLTIDSRNNSSSSSLGSGSRDISMQNVNDHASGDGITLSS